MAPTDNNRTSPLVRALLDAAGIAVVGGCSARPLGAGQQIPPLEVHVDGAGAFPELTAETPHGVLTRISALPGGTASGAPSVGLLVRLDDGSHIFAETSLRLLLTAAAAFGAHYSGELKP